MLANEWDAVELEEWGLEVPNFEAEEQILEAEEDDYEVPDGGIETDIVIGDLFEIGEHRLLCGDSTDSDAVAKLMNGQKADMVFTDPPYDLENEDYHSNIYIFTENAHVFVMHDDKGIVSYLRQSKLEFSRFYVANFGFSSPRGNDPYLSHILISQEKNGNAIPHKNMYDGFRSIIPMEYRFRLKDDKTEHKHQKPIKFIETFIKHFSNDSAKVLDLFLGSGSTMVASHQLKRKCYGLELDPKYCQVIIDRMKKLDQTLTIKRNGQII
jgi:DNA modification methylase